MAGMRPPTSTTPTSRNGHNQRLLAALAVCSSVTLAALIVSSFVPAVAASQETPKWLIDMRNDVSVRLVLAPLSDGDRFEGIFPAASPINLADEALLRVSGPAGWRSQCLCPRPWSPSSSECRKRCRSVRRARALYELYLTGVPSWSIPLSKARPDIGVDPTKRRVIRLTMLPEKHIDSRLVPSPAMALGSFDAADNLHGAVSLTYSGTTDVVTFRHGLETLPRASITGHVASLTAADGRVYLVSLAPTPCWPLVIKDLRSWRAQKAGKLRVIEDSPYLEVEERKVKEEEEDVDLRIPEHVKADAKTQQDVIDAMAGYFALRCHQKNFTPPSHFVVNRDVWKKAQLRENEYWRERLEGDPECQDLSWVKYAPVGALVSTNVVCFPGSGSKWMMELLEFASGISTNITLSGWLGKVHHTSHQRIFHAMLRHSAKPKPDRPLLERSSSLSTAGGRAILHLRSPYDAIASWYNHVLSEDAYGKGLPKEELEKHLSSPHFCDFAVSEAKDWFELVADWATSGQELLVTTHERFLEEPEEELYRMAAFLKVPLNRRRLFCLQKYPMTLHRRPDQRGGGEGRRRKPRKTFFCPKAVEAVEEALTRAGAILKKTLGVEFPSNYFFNQTSSSALSEGKC